MIAKRNNIWEKRAYTDDFGKPTKKYYVSQKQKQTGYFSDSATSNSSMSYYAFIDKDEISFKFWDYEKYQLKNAHSECDHYKFKCLASSGERFEATAIMYGNTDELVIDEQDKVTEFIKMFQKNKSVEIIINRSYGIKEYRFTMQRGNFNKLFTTK